MKFKYKKYGPKYIRPVINIRVANKDGSKSRRYEVLIDSGADLNIFDAQIAELLDLDLETGQKAFVYGITSEEAEPFYIHEILLDIGGHKFKSYAGFKPGLKNSYGNVGQVGFFDEFVVQFDLLKEEIELKERK